MAEPIKIRVAILGGGLAGATLLRGLLLYPHVEVNIYESRPAFKEEGAGVGLQQNAIDALKAISPALLDCLDAAGAVTTNGAKVVFGRGPDAGVEVKRYSDASGGLLTQQFQNVGRHALLRELLAPVPETCLHASKKLERLEISDKNPQQSLLFFSDGTSTTADIVVGADGVHSLVRNYVLGEGHEAAAPRFAGWWHTACLVPLAKAQAVLGTELINTKQPRQHVLIGSRGQAILYDFVHGTEMVQCIICVRGDKIHDPSETPNDMSRDQILVEYSQWPEKLGQDYVNLICDNMGHVIRCWPQLEHKAAPSYVTETIALVGDAAHCMTPWQGSGAAMAIEDALVLSRLLGLVKSVAQVPSALRAYDQTRRPRAQRTVESSFETGMLLTGRNPEVGFDKGKLEQGLRSRWDFLRDFNAEEHVAEAIRVMESAP